MPQLELETPSGPVDWHYNISTPTLACSPAIIPELPCVLFLHGSYCAQDVFEPQFADPLLRKHLNLIAVDSREYGGTKGPITKDYTPAVAADDVHRFMQVLQLPPVHIFALSIGCCVALELAMAHSNVVLSLTLCSPLSSTELEDVAAGRLEVFEYWKEALVHQGNPSAQAQTEMSDPMLLEDIKFGTHQLLYNNHKSRMVAAQYMNVLDWVTEGWAGSPEKLNVGRTIGIEWFLDRKPYQLESLAKINCPINLIHCSEDVAYPIKYAQELQSQLREAGLTDVFFHEVSGPHLGSFVNAQAINPILRDFVLSIDNRCSQPEPLPKSEFHQYMRTPFTEMFARHGYDPFDSEEFEQ